MRTEIKGRESIKLPSGMIQVYVISGRIEITVAGRAVEYLLPGHLSKIYVSDGENIEAKNVLAVPAEVIILRA